MNKPLIKINSQFGGGIVSRIDKYGVHVRMGKQLQIIPLDKVEKKLCGNSAGSTWAAA